MMNGSSAELESDSPGAKRPRCIDEVRSSASQLEVFKFLKQYCDIDIGLLCADLVYFASNVAKMHLANIDADPRETHTKTFLRRMFKTVSKCRASQQAFKQQVLLNLSNSFCMHTQWFCFNIRIVGSNSYLRFTMCLVVLYASMHHSIHQNIRKFDCEEPGCGKVRLFHDMLALKLRTLSH